MSWSIAAIITRSNTNRKLKKLLAETLLAAATLKKIQEKAFNAQGTETCRELGDQDKCQKPTGVYCRVH